MTSGDLSAARGKRSIYSCNTFLMLWTRLVAYTDSESAYILILDCLEHLASAINKHMFDGLDFSLSYAWIQAIVDSRPLNTACSRAAIIVKVDSTCYGKCTWSTAMYSYVPWSAFLQCLKSIWGWKLRLRSCAVVHTGMTAPVTTKGSVIYFVPNCHLLGSTHLG